jgi:hypothetical protein
MSTRRIAALQSAYRRSRTLHGAELFRHQRELEALLRSDRGQRVLAACDGDAEEAKRIIDELERMADAAEVDAALACSPLDVDESAGQAEVVTLPRPYDRELEETIGELVDRRPGVPVGFAGWTVAIAVGSILWLIIAAAGYGLFLIVQAATS